MTVSAHEAVTTHVCKQWGCTNEVRERDGYCKEHRKRENETLEGAISQLINLGYDDPLEIVRQLKTQRGEKWLHAQLIAHDEDLTTQLVRQQLGAVRRSEERRHLPATARTGVKRDILLVSVSIPGRGYMKFGDCTADDLALRRRMYERGAAALLRGVEWIDGITKLMRDQGAQRVRDIKGQLPDFPELDVAGELTA